VEADVAHLSADARVVPSIRDTIFGTTAWGTCFLLLTYKGGKPGWRLKPRVKLVDYESDLDGFKARDGYRSDASLHHLSIPTGFLQENQLRSLTLDVNRGAVLVLNSNGDNHTVSSFQFV
jgi:hypothetical protein